MKMPPDYYEILEVNPNASDEVIAKAYRVLAARFHPDTHPPERRSWAEARMKLLSEAYAVLSDRRKRQDYDRARATAQKAVSSVSGTAPAPVDPTLCVWHPTRKRISICFDCGSSVCAECRVIHGGKPYCRECGSQRALAEQLGAQRSSLQDQLPDPDYGLLRDISGWEAALGALTILAAMPWLYRLAGPVMVVDAATCLLSVALCAVVGGTAAYGLALGLPRIRRIWSRYLGASAAAALLIALVFGVRAVGSVMPQIRAHVAETREIREEESAYRSFEREWRKLAPRVELERFYDLERSPSPSAFDQNPQPPSQSIDQDQLHRAEGAAKRYLDIAVNRQKSRRRAECLHFLVWAQFFAVRKSDATKWAEECLQTSSDPNSNADCLSYLARAERTRGEAKKLLQKITDDWIEKLNPPQQVRVARALVEVEDPRAGEIGLKVMRRVIELGRKDLLGPLADDLKREFNKDSKNYAGRLSELGDLVARAGITLIADSPPSKPAKRQQGKSSKDELGAASDEKTAGPQPSGGSAE